MTDNQLQQVMAVLTRLSIAFERIADQLAGAATIGAAPAIAHSASPPAPIPITGHEMVFGGMTQNEIKLGTSTFPGTAAIAAAMNEPAIPYDTVRATINSYADAHGEHAAQTIIKRFGATYIKDLKAHPERYAEVLEALKS